MRSRDNREGVKTMVCRPWRIMIAGWALLLLLVSVIPTGSALASPAVQSYSFTIPEMLMHVYVQPDGSARIVYDITFQNWGDPIDIVDIGLPHEDYDITTMQASIDGYPLSDIRPSTYIDVGVEIHLGSYAIPSNGVGTLHFEATMPDMVYADTTNEANASLQITPTWFDSDLVAGSGIIEIRVTLLPDIQLDEVLYQDEPFTGKYLDDQGRPIVVWRFEDVSPTKSYRVGVSFPRRGLTHVVEVTFWDLLGRWLGGAVTVLTGALGVCLPILIPGFVLFIMIRTVIRASKPHYLPPIAQVEGGGIKRGLTAPEAAALLQLPLNKVLALVIFGMLEKGLIRQTEADPLTVEVVEDFRTRGVPGLDSAEARAAYRRKKAQEKGTVIHQYEQPFLDLFETHPGIPVRDLDVVKPMKVLIDGVAEKMKGFDLSDTQDYYRRIIDRAMEQAQGLTEPEQRQAYLDRYLPWIMMRPDYRPIMTVGGYNYWPRWARQTSTSGGGLRASRTPGGRSGRSSTTTFGDVSASFAGWAEKTMGSMAAAIMPTTLSKPGTVTHTSSGGGSFRSSCACACAGCACACACAGGGR